MKVNEVVFSEDVTFRYRSTKSILGYLELENSEIYFCPFNEEDDIFEGTLNLYWQADEILWNNFFSHYLLVFGWHYNKLLLQRKIPEKIEWRIDRRKFCIERQISDFLNTKAVKIVKELAMKDNHRVQPYEMELYLKIINFSAFKIISSLFDSDYLYTDDSKEMEIQNIKWFDDAEKNFSELNLIFEKFSAEIFNFDNSKIDSLIKWLLIDFPLCYFKILPEMTFPQWYVASFCKSCNDGRNWAQYGDSHKGVCLIFKTHNTTNGKGIKLKVCNEYSTSQGKIYRYDIKPLKTVKYKDNHPEFNFFDMLGTIPRGIKEHWIKDEAGNVSKFYESIGNVEEQKWQNKYWEFFENIVTSKSNDWNGLEEERIVLENIFFEEYNSIEDRKIQYDFNDLKGIIFGYKISKDDKQKIKEIIKEKCDKFGRKDFEFYNADKNYKTGKIVILKEM